MNIITGMMMPLMNCAPNAAWYSSLVLGVELRLHLLLATVDLDELVAGEGLLDDAVELAGGATAGRTSVWLRRRWRLVTSTEIGMVTSATSASCHEIQNIMPSTATTVSSELSSWESVCCSDVDDVVQVVGDPAEQLTARLGVEVGQRQPAELGFDRLAQPVHGVLDDALQDPARDPQHEGRHDVDEQHDEQDAAHGSEVDALARDEVHAGQQVGDLGLSLGAQPRDDLLAAQPGRRLRARRRRRR